MILSGIITMQMITYINLKAFGLLSQKCLQLIFYKAVYSMK